MQFPVWIIALGPLLLILAGFGLVWWARERAWDRPSGRSSFSSWVQGVGVVILVIGTAIAITLMTHVFAIFTWLFLSILLLAVMQRYRDTQRQSLMWVLMSAAERGIPLEPAVRGFANEHHGALGRRLHKLADYLEVGLPLSMAMQRAGFRLSVSATLAADLGQTTNSLNRVLRGAAQHGDEFDSTFRAVTHWFLYLGVIICWGAGIILFLSFAILPPFMRLFREFDIELPGITQAIWDLTQLTSVTGWVLLGLFVLGIGVMGLGIIQYIGIPLRYAPIVRRLWWPADCSLVLQWLGYAVSSHRSLPDMVRSLSVFYPQVTMRKRLERALQQIESGAHWCDALRQQQILRRSDTAVLLAAERVGNLSWALEELSCSGLRRTATWLKAFVDTSFPVFVLVLGGMVLLIASAVILPLATLIQVLS